MYATLSRSNNDIFINFIVEALKDSSGRCSYSSFTASELIMHAHERDTQSTVW